MKLLRTCIVGALAVSLAPSVAWAWGAEGHQAVGAIADRLLEGTRAGQMVKQTLAGQNLETVAVWADCVKGTTSSDGESFSYQADIGRFPECAPFETPEQRERIIAFVKANWAQCGVVNGNEHCHNQYHYTDVAIQRQRYDRRFAGTSDHDVVHAISATIDVLQGKPAPSPFKIADQREALTLLAHYIGDLHQPLHVESVYLDEHGEKYDPDARGYKKQTDTAGGNLVYVGRKKMHSLWDGIPDRLSTKGDSFADTVQRARLVGVSPGTLQSWSTQWANEVILSGQSAFADLKFGPHTYEPPPSSSTPTALKPKSTMAALEFTPKDKPQQMQNTTMWDAFGVDDDYVRKADELKQAEIALAGARLAQVLQAIWPDAPQAATTPRTIPLRLIVFNDFHGNLESGNLSLPFADPLLATPSERVPVGGMAALSGMVKLLRIGMPYSLTLSSGDLLGASPLVSTLYRHETTVMQMNQLELDASVVGNHEFDAGLDELLRLKKGGCAATVPDALATSCAIKPYEGMQFDLLGANVHKDGETKSVLDPVMVKKVEGIPVAFIGVVTKETPSMVLPSGVKGLKFDDEVEVLNRTAAQLKRHGIKAIVAMVHEGGEVGTQTHPVDWNDTRCDQARGRIFDIARQVSSDVDVLLTAHTHQGYRCLVDGRLVIQGTSFGRGLSVVDLALDPSTGDIDRAQTTSINLPVVNERTTALQRAQLARLLPPAFSPIVRQSRPDEAVAKQVAGYAQQIAPKANREVARIGAVFEKGSSRGDHAMGRLIADAQLAAARAALPGESVQLAFMNDGGVRSDLRCANGQPPCVVTFGQLFAAQPFSNDLVVMSLTGAQIKAVLEQQQKPGMTSPYFLQPSAGLTYEWHEQSPIGQRVAAVTVHGQPLDTKATYRVVVNTFLSQGGDGFDVLLKGTDRHSAGNDLDALLAYLKPGLDDPAKAAMPTAESRGRVVP